MSITKDLAATAIIGSSVIAGLVTGPLIGATIGGVNGHTHEDETQAYFDKYYPGVSEPDMLARGDSWIEGTNPLANYLHKVVEKNTGSEGLAKTIAMAGGILSGLVAGILQGPAQGLYFGERLVNKLELI